MTPRRTPRTTALAHLAFLLCAACSAHDVTAAPRTASTSRADRAADTSATAEPHADTALRRRLERAAAGLLYTSESDVPFTWFEWAGPEVSPLDTEAMRVAAGASADEPIETVTLDQFFARHIERVDPADATARALIPRYRRLRETLRHAARDVRVFRVGRIRIRCYLVGADRDGRIVGLYTEAIET